SDEGVKEETVKVEESNENTPEVNEKPAADPEPKEEPQQEQPKEEPAVEQKLEAVATSGRQTTYRLTNAEKFEVSISSTGETWVEVKDGTGKKYFSNMLRNGETQTFDLTGQSQADIIVGFSPDTVIKVNGETLQYKLPPADQVRQDILIQAQKAAE
ncbi:MAG TPA: DUF4115 domain-containing protein, partial [Chondromyces sp.]|nr:DUF4115 domain-containing protein [Chondromyces sp.]